ncbi:hypothetical protein [Radicibacter daui]|uniref:hypothetical protein n=1 Tax=Radicibacter daui TaxID=3064829 RepID=UPI004046A5B1
MTTIDITSRPLPPVRPARHEPKAREINLPVPEDLATVDLIELYLEIEASLADQDGVAIQLLAASAGNGSTEIALDMACAATAMLGKRILVLNCTRDSWTPLAQPSELVKLSCRDLYIADLRSLPGRNLSAARAEEIGACLAEFRRQFDMVIVVPPPADSEPLGAVLSGQVDGNIVVIEAELTPRSSAIRLRELLRRCHRPILGAVLHGRRNHVPHWMAGLV